MLNPSYRFVYLLRSVEYHFNSKGIYHKILFFIYYYFYLRISLKTGITIPKNVCNIGLQIPHYGSIVVSGHAIIGKNCRIHNNVNIGAVNGFEAPIIGDNVYIGPGAVLYGKITIADNCVIGANSVVNKSFNEPYSLVVGVPGRVVNKLKI